MLLALAALGIGAASAQPDVEARDEAPRSSTESIDEITVLGQRTLGVLRLETQAARERVYDLFNALNSDRAFDIHCRNAPRTGTRIRQRVCRPQYADDATSNASRDFLSAIFFECEGEIFSACSAGALSRAQVAHTEIHHMDLRLAEEIQRVTRESPEFRRAIAEYQALERRYQDARQGDAALIRTSIVAMPPTMAVADRALVPPVAIERPTPQPPSDQRAGGSDREGWVKLRYSVLADGTTAGVRVIDAVPAGFGTSGAVAAVEGWTFEPATATGAPIDWHNSSVLIAFQREDTLLEASPAFVEAYDEVAQLISEGDYDGAKSRNQQMQSELASRLYEIALAQMQLAALEHALGDPHAALDAVRRATQPGVAQLADEELQAALEHRFTLELQLGRAMDALETYQRRTELDRMRSNHPIARLAAGIRQSLEGPQATLTVQNRLDPNGHAEHALTWPTFAVGDVDGRIEEVGVECNRNQTVLSFDVDVEVTIPASWGECTLLFNGQRNTTFTLYEFREPMG